MLPAKYRWKCFHPHLDYKSVSYQAAVWLSPAGGDGIESSNSPAPISPTSMSISYGEVGPTSDGLHSSNPWNESIGIGNVSYAKVMGNLVEKKQREYKSKLKIKLSEIIIDNKKWMKNKNRTNTIS